MEARNFCQIHINLSDVIRNYQTAVLICEPKTRVTCVLKGNAYGHGMLPIAKALSEAGCQSFAVSSAREAFTLRSGGILGEILIMGVTESAYLSKAALQSITITISSYEQALAITTHTDVHIKVDTGMHRLGFSCDHEGIAVILKTASLPYIRIRGIYSHLGLVNAVRDHEQHAKLMNMVNTLHTKGLSIQDVHICDSIGMVRYPDFCHSRVRIGAFLYGVRPYGSEHMPFECLETLSFTSVITQIHHVNRGDYVGYDDEPLSKDTRVATIQAGYADGYPRRMAKRAHVIIRGRKALVISRVCMDQMMVDVTHIPEAMIGDEVILLGSAVTYHQYAEWANSNRNEILSVLTARPQRAYYKDGHVAEVQDLLCDA